MISRVNTLEKIIATKRREIEALLPREEELRRAALRRNEFRGFRTALRRQDGGIGIIGEVKRASPSAGRISAAPDPMGVARIYEKGGADAVSVLTDRGYFQGSLADMELVRSGIGLPVLRKDFMIAPVQIFEAAAAGADAILLIVAALPDDELRRLQETAALCQLDVLVEVHSMEELDRALELSPDLVGINNRNLKTFETDLATTEQLAPEVDDHITVVSESGIRTGEDVARVRAAGADAVLVGESLMRHPDPAALLAEFRKAGRA